MSLPLLPIGFGKKLSTCNVRQLEQPGWSFANILLHPEITLDLQCEISPSMCLGIVFLFILFSNQVNGLAL